MKQKVRFFRQHSLETCGISCVLTALDFFGRVKYPTVKQEMKLYGIYRCRAFKGTLSSAIAECLCRNGLEVGLFHSSPEYLDNRGGYYPEGLYREMLGEYKRGVERVRDRARVETGCRFGPGWYRARLDEGKLLIVQCVVPGNADGMHDETLHWILLYGYEGEEFLACDPVQCKIRLTEAETEKYTDTPVGKICVTVCEGGDGTAAGDRA